MKNFILILALLGVLGVGSQANAGVHVSLGFGGPAYYGYYPAPYAYGPYYGRPVYYYDGPVYYRHYDGCARRVYYPDYYEHGYYGHGVYGHGGYYRR